MRIVMRAFLALLALNLYSGCASSHEIKYYDGVADVVFREEDFIVTCDVGMKGKNEILDEWDTFRPDCVIKTPAILAYAASQIAEVKVDYEANWSTFLIPLPDIQTHRLARIDIKYDHEHNHKFFSELIAPPNIIRRATIENEGCFFGNSKGVLTHTMTPLTLPEGASNLEVRIANIPPKTYLKIHQISIRLLTKTTI